MIKQCKSNLCFTLNETNTFSTKHFFTERIFVLSNSGVPLINLILGYILIVMVHMSYIVTTRWTLDADVKRILQKPISS